MTGAKLVATCDAGRRELPGGWVAVTGGLISGIGAAADPVPDAHLYVAPRRGGDLWSAEIAAAREVGLRFHPTRGWMTLSVKDGGLPPDSVVQDNDEVLADSGAPGQQPPWPRLGAMVRVALGPCSVFSVSPELMRRTAELARVGEIGVDG